MTILSIVCTKLLCTNAHLGRRVAYHHFKVYIRGSRNGIAILDSDKTLICLRNALHFIGSLSRQKGRFFFLKTNHLFDLEIMEEMVSYFRNVNSHCFDDSQWKIGAFLTNSFANKKKFRSRKKKIHFGLNQQPDCVVILNANTKSSVILEADRLQIPMVSLGDSTIPWEWFRTINYTVPTRDSIEMVYFFCHSMMKTVIMEQKAETKAIPRKLGVRSYSTSSPKGGPLRFFFSVGGVIFAFWFFLKVDISWIPPDQAVELVMSLSQSLLHMIGPLFRQIGEIWNGGERCAPLGGTELMGNTSPEEATSKAGYVSLMNSAEGQCIMHSEDGEASVNQPPANPDEGPAASEASVNQGGGSDVPPLNLDLNRPSKSQEDTREYAESIKDFRIDEQFENFKNEELTKPLYEQLCAYVGDADAVKNECIREISENFHVTDAGLIDFVKQTDTSEGQRRVIFNLIKLHFKDELRKLPPELQNANQENESSSEDDSDEDE